MFRCDGYEVIKLFRRAGLLLGFENEDHVSCARLPSMCRSGAFIVSLGGEASQRVIAVRAEGEKRERGREGGRGCQASSDVCCQELRPARREGFATADKQGREGLRRGRAGGRMKRVKRRYYGLPFEVSSGRLSVS